MRGQWLLVGLVLVALTAPAVAAVTGPSTAMEPERDETRDLRWSTPTHGYVDHPVHASVALYVDEVRQTHQDFRVMVMLDDQVLFDSTHIHEHDGFHTLVITPPGPGTLLFIADDDLEAHHDGLRGLGGDSPHSAPFGVMATVPILPGAPHHWTGDEVTRMYPRFHQVEDHHLGFMGDQHIGHQSFVDITDPEGRLILHTVPRPNSWHANLLAAPPGGFGQGQIRALVTSFPTINQTLFTESISANLDFEETHTARVSSGATRTAPALPACTDSDVPILSDPSSIVENRLAWQTWTDVRFALETTDHLSETDPGYPNGPGQPPGAKYQFFAMAPAGPVVGGSGGITSYEPYDPFRQLTLRFREPGTYTMTVTRDSFADPECTVDFTILPNTDNEPGALKHLVTVDNDTARVQFLAQRDGTSLPHYEFDTRVVKLHTEDTPGRLVWKGKLHGHQGYAMFELAGLEAGDYEVRTHPSPQDLGTPPLAAESDDGFVYRFTVDAPAEPEPTVAAPDTARAPGVGIPALLAPLLVALGILARRRPK